MSASDLALKLQYSDTTPVSGTSVTPHVARWLVQREPDGKRFEIAPAPARRGAVSPRPEREADGAPRTPIAIRP